MRGGRRDWQIIGQMLMLLALPGVCWAIQPRKRAMAALDIEGMVQATARAIVEAGGPGSDPHSVIVGGINMELIMDTPVPTPTAAPVPTPTMMVVPQPETVNDNDPELRNFALSFYDPNIYWDIRDEALRATNCLTWDFALDECVSKVHGGLDDYHEWYRKGAACTQELPMGVVFEVIEPKELRGVWRCIDRGALDVFKLGQWWHYIDFMLDYPADIWTGPDLNLFPWSAQVVVKVLSVP